jgi:Protein of unknown function (DUF2798)
MTSQKRHTVIVILLMTTMMGFVMSAYFTWQAIGFTRGFLQAWASRYVSTYAIVLPTVLLVSPIAQKLASAINDWFDRRSP